METITPTPLKKKQIMKLLATAYPNGLKTSEIVKEALLQFKSKISRPTISKHTNALIDEKRANYVKRSKKFFLTYDAYITFWSEGSNKVMTSEDADASATLSLRSYIYDVLFEHQMKPSRIWDLPILRNIELGKWRDGEAFRNNVAELIVKSTTISIRGPNFRTESLSLDTRRLGLYLLTILIFKEIGEFGEIDVLIHFDPKQWAHRIFVSQLIGIMKLSTLRSKENINSLLREVHGEPTPSEQTIMRPADVEELVDRMTTELAMWAETMGLMSKQQAVELTRKVLVNSNNFNFKSNARSQRDSEGPKEKVD